MKPKKLRLTKITVAALSDYELSQVRGATFYWGCTEDTKSCSIHMQCCIPPNNMENENEGV
jgi:hypothetical protein